MTIQGLKSIVVCNGCGIDWPDCKIYFPGRDCMGDECSCSTAVYYCRKCIDEMMELFNKHKGIVK